MDRLQEFAEKRSRLVAMLNRLGLDAVLIGTTCNFAWLTCGGNNYVGTATQYGSAAALISKGDCWILCDNIEYPRIRDEEIIDLNFEFMVYPWYASDMLKAISNIVGKCKIGGDISLAGVDDITSELRAVRSPLTEAEIDRYRELGSIVGQSIEKAARAVKPEMTENQVMGMLNEMLISYGIVPTCTLAASDDRILRYRHPLPTDKPVEREIMIITGARKWGLIVSSTRMVSLGEPSEELVYKHKSVVKVDAQYISTTRPGKSVGDVFRAGMDAYTACGYPNEWQLHHQGGPTGYEAREYKATQHHTNIVSVNTAYAWNPSITGTKSEDTILVLEDRNEIISATLTWPKIKVETSEGMLMRPDVLRL